MKKLNENKLREIIRESIMELCAEVGEESTNSIVEKANAIMNELRALNFEQRGHEIYDCSGDEESPEIGVGNMNVPAIADCRMIAEKLGCNFHVDNSWGIGIFELY